MKRIHTERDWLNSENSSDLGHYKFTLSSESFGVGCYLYIADCSRSITLDLSWSENDKNIADEFYREKTMEESIEKIDKLINSLKRVKNKFKKANQEYIKIKEKNKK